MDLRHVVLLRFADGTDADAVARLQAHFVGLRREIEGISAAEAGRNVSPEGLDRGFTHAFVMHFRDDAARDAYLPHPAHQAFVDALRPVLGDVLVIDYRPDTLP
ncbi:Dabb family protein [Aquabacterium humicola]|uniref:Dabb family protein n=1 Tax=Aquabacterium humicola TaxID=3237377 RepID=UPI002542EDF2|nr:Dabb family protein [Rubrivivax pictus]